jgi:uncharacterized protein
MRRSDREIKDIALIEEIIAIADVCRIAIANDNVPYIVTMNFGYQGGENPCFWFHCAESGRKLEMIGKNNHVCFELDGDHEIYEGENGCDWGMKFSSIIGYGKISVVSGVHSKIEGLNCIMKKYSGRESFSYNEKVLEKTTVLRLDVEEMTGKRK